MANLDKNAIINLKNDAHLENTYNTNIVFSTADQDSDTLRFKLLKNDGLPYIIGNVNVGGKIKLDHEDGSFWIDNLKVVENELKYQFEYQLPNELLQRNGKVTAQVLVYEKGNSSLVVAQRKFTFNIQNSIYQNISAEDKTTHIVEFAELKQEIRQTVVDINETLENGEDFVTQIKTSHREALDAIQTLATSTTDELNNLGDKRLNEIQTTASDYLSQIDAKNDDAQKRIDDFKNYLVDQDIVLVSDTKDWQKHKLTTDDGSYKSIDIKNDLSTYQNLEPGFYYTSNVPIKDVGQTSAAGWTIVEQRQNYSNLKRITFRPYNSNQQFVLRYYNDWGTWENALANVETTSGSQEKATTAENNAKEYTDSRHQVLFDGEATGVNSTIKLQDDYTNYNLLVISGYFPGGEWTKAHLVANTRSIHVTETNLVDDTANGGGIYELLINKTDSKTFTIGIDNYLEIISNTPYTNANKFTVQRIEGWK